MAIQTTTNTYQTRLNKAFYDRKLLETAKTRLVHASFGQKRSIPKHNGKRVEFRRYELFTPNQSDLTLVEGVTPDGQSLAQSGIEATVKQYGAYVEVSDLLDMTAYDEVIADSAELLGEQLGTVIEWVTRDAMASTTNVQYVNGKTARNQLEPTDKLTVDDIRKAVRTEEYGFILPAGKVQVEEVGPDLGFGPDGSRNLVPVLMELGVLFGKGPPPDQFLDNRMVSGNLADGSPVQTVKPAVADIGNGKVLP